jgi:pumilio family protein 6
MPTNEREQLIAAMAKKMSGNILQVTLRHDASRMVQCVIQFGTDKQRRDILNEMLPRIYEV